MTQSKKNDESTFTLDMSDIIDTTGDITINLNDTVGTTTTYWAGDSITDTTYSITTDDTISISDGTFTIDTDGADWLYDLNNNKLDPKRVERMIKHYPGLEKVWRNFKQVYDMCEQDYEGKIKAGEINDDDDIPF